MPTIRTQPPTLAHPTAVADGIKRFIQRSVSEADADGVVINLSGGIDSTVTATLAADALGSDRTP